MKSYGPTDIHLATQPAFPSAAGEGPKLVIRAANGNVGIGNLSPAEKLHVSGNVRIDGTAYGNFSGTFRGTGYGNFNGTFVETSDERLKKDFSSIDHSLEKLLRIHGYTFYWQDPSRGGERRIGLKAQEVERSFPELVKTTADGFKAVAYQNLVAPIIEGLRELHEKILALINADKRHDQRISELERKIETLVQHQTELERENDTLHRMLQIQPHSGPKSR
ncbi:MAG: tail fiber domain-containing protein, partial [Bdellovibrionaceae bacterium]|nr:tail fiber domain-containing protein [Pseudobdellovibrionaceae bacterium]